MTLVKHKLVPAAVEEEAAVQEEPAAQEEAAAQEDSDDEVQQLLMLRRP
jgi:hypothetical protein